MLDFEFTAEEWDLVRAGKFDHAIIEASARTGRSWDECRAFLVQRAKVLYQELQYCGEVAEKNQR